MLVLSTLSNIPRQVLYRPKQYAIAKLETQIKSILFIPNLAHLQQQLLTKSNCPAERSAS